MTHQTGALRPPMNEQHWTATLRKDTNMGRWRDKNNQQIANSIGELGGKNHDKAIRDLQRMADEAAKHDRGDAKVMREIVENHRKLG